MTGASAPVTPADVTYLKTVFPPEEVEAAIADGTLEEIKENGHEGDLPHTG